MHVLAFSVYFHNNLQIRYALSATRRQEELVRPYVSFVPWVLRTHVVTMVGLEYLLWRGDCGWSLTIVIFHVLLLLILVPPPKLLKEIPTITKLLICTIREWNVHHGEFSHSMKFSIQCNMKARNSRPVISLNVACRHSVLKITT